jgi:general secretion pathway protein D
MIKKYLKMRLGLTRFALVLILGTLVACVSPLKKADNFIAQEEWLKAVLELRKAAADEPADVEFKLRLKQTELKAAEYYYKRGMILYKQENLDGAAKEFQQGLAAMPDNDKLQQAMKQVLLTKEANNLYSEALHLLDAGKQNEGHRLLKRAVEMNPDFKRAVDLLARMDKQYLEKEEESDRLKVTSRAPITLNFRQTDLRTAFEFIAKSFGIDVVFDDAVKSMPITLFAKDVKFEQALSLMLSTTKTFYKKVGPNTILIAPDSKEKRGQYEDQMIRVFQLTNIHAKEMADILKGVVPLKKIIINEQLNTIVVRDTEEAIKVASKVIDANDRRPAELILEVEILEVNRSKAERLGLDLSPYRISAAVPADTVLPLLGGVGGAFQDNAVLTLPSAALNFYKQDVDAKTLANPRLRVLSGKNAKIHIGDRVPLRASTIQDATGQVRTTYDYKDIGIKLTAEPIIHLDNSVTVKVNLEVSSLGQNIGTLTEPAYSIGTRNAETFMLLRDGETAILGGLIRDEDRKSRTTVPLIGDIPLIGRLFASSDDSSGTTDVLLTITPRVVRSWDMPDKEAQMFTSGSEERFTSQPLFGNFVKPADEFNNPVPLTSSGKVGAIKSASVNPEPVISSSISPATTNVENAVKKQFDGSEVLSELANDSADKNILGVTSDQTTKQAVSGLQPLLTFSNVLYEGSPGKEFEIILTGENLGETSGVTTEVQFNPQLVKYLRNEIGNFTTKDYKIELDESKGLIRINLIFSDKGPKQDKGVLARLIMRGDKPGTSYIVYRTPVLSLTNGKSSSAQVRASRVIIK